MNTNRLITLITRQLAGEASVTELAELEQILADDEAALAAATTLKNYWDTHPPVDQDFLEATYHLHTQKMNATGIAFNKEENRENAVSKNPYLTRTAVNQVLVALIGISIVFYMFFIYQPQRKISRSITSTELDVAEVVTQAGSRTNVLLPDGTRIWLNSGSKITYKKKFSEGNREVSLEGEAYFDVFKNAKLPFIIHTATMDIKVTGTIFNVKAYKGEATTETSLISGSVEVLLASDTAIKYFLKEKQKLILKSFAPTIGNVAEDSKEKTATKESITIIPTRIIAGTDINLETSWTRNILSFADERFDMVALMIERWYNVKIEFKNQNWQGKFLSGTFENETLQGALTALKYSTGFNFKIDGNKVTIY